MNKNYITITATLIAGAVCVPVARAADEAIPAETVQAYELNPVVVTGTGVHQRLKDTPVAVEVISGEEIRNAGTTDLQEALTMTIPSLSFSPNAMGSYLRMNGLTNSHVLVLVNGRKLVGDISGNVDLGQIDVSRIKRIEVLNGAASTLYGSDAVGGVINIIMDEPTDRAQFDSSSRYMRKNRFDQSLGLSLSAGKVGSFTGYNYSHSDGWQNSHFTESDGELVPSIAQLSLGYTSNNLTQRFTYKPTEKLSIYADGTYYNRLLDRPVERKDITGGSKYNTFSESWSWGAGGAYRLGSLGSVTFDYAGRTYGQYYKYMVQSGNFLPGDYDMTKRQKYHEAELRGLFNFTDASTTVFGLDYRHETLIRPESDLDKGLGSFAAYAQHEHRLWNSLTALAGVRMDSYQDLGTRVTPKVSLMYKMADFNVRGTYAMGYRSPGIDELYYHMLKPMGSRHIITFGNPDLKAETSNYVSVNMEYRTTAFTVALTGYLNFVRNMVTSKSTKFNDLDESRRNELIDEFPEINDIKQSTLSIKEYYNFDKATVKGLEANVSSNPLPGLSLSLNYALAYGRGFNDGSGWQRLNRSVMHSGTFMAKYTRRWNFYEMNLNLTGRVQSKTYYPGDADGNAPGYGIWNLNTRHTFDCFRSFTLTPGIGIDNIFNRRDRRPLNSNFALYSPGRSFMVSLAVTLK